MAAVLYSGYAARLNLDIPSAEKDSDCYDDNNSSHDEETAGDQTNSLATSNSGIK